MKLTVLGLLLCCLVMVVAIQSVPRSQTVEIPQYSEEFKVKAQAAIDAIERLQFYSGALPKFEADKAMTELSHLLNSVGESNAYAVISNYRFAINIALIGTTRKEWTTIQGNQPFPDLDKARAELNVIRMHLH